jgi:hypothetical protein
MADEVSPRYSSAVREGEETGGWAVGFIRDVRELTA